ncbi:aldo/keto reductase [Halegenticoccus tardaugens]|uniref:aldo/keto reductase n=1 Tax=Halegenticoccus tardaugens TaxID=2071624 RepID=UPI003743A3E9
MNFIDTANVCGSPLGESERYIGKWLVDHDREQFVLTPKVYGEMDSKGPNGPGSLSETHLSPNRRNLDRFRTDYLNLYYIH